MLTIAQISDLHITTDADPENRRINARRLRQTLQSISRLRPRPVAIIATGDLVDRGEIEEYRALRNILARVEIPIYLGLGNHDRRDPFLSTFGAPRTATDTHGFIQFAVEFDGFRVLICDTLDEGRDAAAFCERRAQWLDEQLTRTSIPTVVALHHPPVPSGISWMDSAPDADWLARLAGIIGMRPQIVGMISGHVHRGFHSAFCGHTVSVAPATAPQLALDLTPIDRALPDARDLLVNEPPGFSLLSWSGERLTVHVCTAGRFSATARFTTPMIAS